MESPEGSDPAGFDDEPEIDSVGNGTGTEIDYTKTEGHPTAHAVLDVVLKHLGLRIFGEARLSSPVMTVVGGLAAAVAIMVVLPAIGSETDHFLALLIAGAVTAMIIVGATTWLAWNLIKTSSGQEGPNRRDG
jgi:hypothetical protein